MICGACSVEPRTHGCAQVEVVEHLLEHEMLTGGLRRSGPRTLAQLIPDSFRFARDPSELACDVPASDIFLRRQRHTAAVAIVQTHSGMIPDCTRHITIFDPSRSTPSCRDASCAYHADPCRHFPARSCSACDVSVSICRPALIAVGVRCCGTDLPLYTTLRYSSYAIKPHFSFVLM